MAVLQITLSWVATRDHRLMVRVNHWRPPKWLRLWMLAATRGGDGGLWYALGLAVALYGGPERFHALLAATLAVATGIAMFLELKRAFRRTRPCDAGAALLGALAAARSILVPLGPHHYGLRGVGRAGRILS